MWKKIIYALIFILIFSVISYLFFSQSREIKRLKEEIKQSQEKVITQEKVIYEIRTQNDIKTKEAIQNEFKKNINMSDNDVDDAWNNFMQGVRQRNQQRRNEGNNN